MTWAANPFAAAPWASSYSFSSTPSTPALGTAVLYLVIYPATGYTYPTVEEVKTGIVNGTSAAWSDWVVDPDGDGIIASPSGSSLGLVPSTNYRTAYVASNGYKDSGVSVSAVWSTDSSGIPQISLLSVPGTSINPFSVYPRVITV